MREIIKKLHNTEKTTKDSEKRNKYTFWVDLKANKIEIKKAVEKMYSVSVKEVNVMVCGAKSKHQYVKNKGMTKAIKSHKAKKAIVETKESIEFSDNI